MLLLDIEGTTTPVDFVYQVLFPFASRNLDSFLREHVRDPEVSNLVAALKAQQKADLEGGLDPPRFSGGSEECEIRSLVVYAQWLIARDSKLGPLKTLEGKIWRAGYESGALRGQVYPDVPRAFRRWRRQGRRICIYSSGSVLAQKLLFRTTTAGDLTALLEAFFDTRIGLKTDTESYRKIAASLDCPTKAALFLSDANRELDAARAAGMRTMLCVRSGPEEVPTSHNPTIHTFDGLFAELSLFDDDD